MFYKVRDLKNILEKFDDNTEIFIRNSHNICGNMSELSQVEISNYGFFGDSYPCLILNSGHSCVADNKGEYYEVIKTSGLKVDNNKMLEKYNFIKE